MPERERANIRWAYILSKEKENMVDPHDVAIYLSFSTNDRLTFGMSRRNLRSEGKGFANCEIDSFEDSSRTLAIRCSKIGRVAP